MTELVQAKIAGLGSAFPENVMTNQDLEKLVDTSDEWIRQRTGIERRHIAPKGLNNSDLGAEASKAALEAAGVDASDVELILYCTNSPDKLLPATACIMQPKIGALNAAAFDINAACAGWILGLSVAQQYVRTGMYRNVLVVGAEVLSRIVNWEDRNTCVLFGDGAGATLVTPASAGEESRILSTHMQSDGRQEGVLDMKAGGTQRPVDADVLAERSQFISMKGKELFKFAVRAMADRCIEAMQANKVSAEDIDWVVPHQANIRIVDAIAERLGVPREKVVLNLQEYGNTSAATVPTAMDGAIRDGRIQRGQLVLLVTFGGGLTSASALVRW